MRSFFTIRRMIVCFRIALCLAICCIGLKAEVTVENRAYHNLLVSFAPNVAPENGKAYLDSLKVLVEETSKTLHAAIGVRIASVTVRLPDTWKLDNVTTVHATVSQSRTSPDILLDARNDSAFGKGPFTLQYGGCGVPGHQITIPLDFLNSTDDTTYPNGKLLAREWLKYRYGVFDENGFADDSLYPLQYSVPGSSDVIVTHCTDPEVDFQFLDPDGNNCTAEEASGNCTGHPLGTDNVTSSLMYFHENLSQVDEVCGGQHPHSEEHPSKHNILCAGKSIWEVIKNSADFSLHEQATPYEEVQFSYAQEHKQRVVVAWQNTWPINTMGDMITFAVRRMLYDLPDDAKCALYRITDQIKEIWNLAEIYKNGGPDKAFITLNENQNFTCAPPCAPISKAVDVLLKDNPDGQGSVILIVNSVSSENEDDLVKKLKESQICLVIIAVGDTDSIAASYDPFVTASPCGSSWTLRPDGDKQHTFNSFMKYMQSAIPEKFSNTKTVTVNTGIMSTEHPILIPVGNLLDKLLLWVGKANLDHSDIKCTMGEETLTLTEEGRTQLDVSFWIEAKEMGQVTCSLQTVTIPVLTQVQLVSNPGEYFDMDSWIQDTTLESDPSQMPVIIYAKVNFGSYPVALAQVKAVVTSPKQATTEMRLIDSGLADPDITQYDGIYSGYFMQFDGEGKYDVHVTVSREEKTFVLKDGTDRCCGKQVEANELTDAPLFTTSSTVSFSAKSAKPEHGYKPSRIIDLRVDSFDLPKSLVLKWTAPGGGKAERYTLKTFSSRFEAIHNFSASGEVFNETLTAAEPGVTDTIDIKGYILDDPKEYYVGIRAVSDKGLESETSNVLVFSTTEDTLRTTGVESSTVVIEEVKPSGMSKQTIGIIIGVLVLVIVLIVLIYLAVYFFGRRHKKRQDEGDRKDKTAENGAPTGANFGLNSIPADVILKHHNEVVTAKREHKNPPIFKEESLDQVQNTPTPGLNQSYESEDGSYGEVPAQHNQARTTAPAQHNDARNIPATRDYTLVQKPGSDLSQPDPRKSPKRMTMV